MFVHVLLTNAIIKASQHEIKADAGKGKADGQMKIDEMLLQVASGATKGGGKNKNEPPALPMAQPVGVKGRFVNLFWLWFPTCLLSQDRNYMQLAFIEVPTSSELFTRICKDHKMEARYPYGGM